MAINTLATATIFQTALDQVAVQEALTGWMDANAGQVIYNGGAEVKIPKMSVQGLGDYDRDNGYVQGSVTLEYETRKMTQDRGRKFQLDAMDVNETNFVVTASSVMGEFQREHVVPEIDAYRLSALATEAIKVTNNGNVVYGYTPAEGTILRKIKEGIAAVRKNGYKGRLMIHISSDAMLELQMAMAGKLTTATFAQGGIDTTCPAIDKDNILIETPDDRMYTAIQIYDGTTSGQTAGGYKKATAGLNMNFIIMPATTPIAVTKQDLMRIFDPTTNQKANAWAFDYRRFHDCWVKDNRVNSIYVSIKDAKPTTPTNPSEGQ